MNDNQSRAEQGESGWEQHEEKMGKYTLGCKAETNWNEEHKGIHLAKMKKTKQILLWAWCGRETDPYPTHKPLKRASDEGAANRFSSAYAAFFWWLRMPAQEEGWEMKLSLLCSLWRWGKKLWKIPQVTGMAIVKVRIRINAHLALSLQFCLIFCCPT